MPDMGLLQGTQTPDNQLTVPEEAQQMVPLDNSNQITASEGAQQIIPVDNATHITTPERANQIKYSEGDILHNKRTNPIVTLQLTKAVEGETVSNLSSTLIHFD